MACASTKSGLEANQVKLFITSFSDEFFAEREFIKNEVVPALRSWCERKKLTLVENFIKWGGRHPDERNVAELERLQTSIENCYFSSIMPIFINITCTSLGWVPMWGEYPEEIVEDYQEAYGLLYEDLELLASAFREDNLNSLYLIRDDSFSTNIPDEEKANFVKLSSASQKICGDCDKISHKFPPHRVILYSADYKGMDTKKNPVLGFSEDLKLKVLDFLQQRIAYDYCGEDRLLASHPDEFAKSAHLEFFKSKGRCVFGRDNIVLQIENYIVKEERDIPLILLGASGSGKTSVMCLAAKTILNRIERADFPGDKSWRLFYHFVGAVPGSTSLEQMLKRLLRETGMTKKNSNCAKDLDSAAQMCCSMLSNLNTDPLIILLDAADQFTKEHGARIISWVPRKLAPQVRLVIAMVTDTEVHKALLGRETKPTEIYVTPLDNTSKQGIIEEILEQDKLSSDQVKSLLGKPSSENPLWLTLACQELKLANGEEKISEKIDSLPDSLLMLFDELLQRLESGREGDLLVGTLCLLEASAAGLNQLELRQLLADETSIKPPSPYEEKEEKEGREKDSKKEKGVLSEERWQLVLHTLQPFLRPYGDSREGRLDFYHRALSKAVRKRYLTVNTDEETSPGKPEKSGTYFFWHSKLADYFRYHSDVSRQVEEYPYHLACLEDKFHLAQCLCDWPVFDRLYHEEYSSQLMAYWRKVGPISEMTSSYEAALKKFEEADSANEAAVSLRYEKVCRVTIQAGKHQDALELLKTAMKIEEKELGARPHRMVELYALMSEIYDEKLKLNDFVSRSQLPDLRKTIHYAKKSIHIRKSLPGSYHKFKLGMSLMRLAFNMKSWDACGGGTELTGPDAVTEGNKYIDRALKIFLELSDMGHYAEALMTKGVLAPRGSMEQLKLYNQAMELCMQMYGELHILTSRLYINIGIVYEDNKDYRRSYQYFKKWARLSEEIMGPDHPKTLRAKGVLRESRYRRIAMELGEWVEDDEQLLETEEEDERSESCEMEHSYDDTLNNILIVSQDEATLETPLTATPSDSSQPTPTTPLFNIVPLLPNSYLESVGYIHSHAPASDRPAPAGGQRNRPRDTSSYQRSRLERSNAIRRMPPSTEQLEVHTNIPPAHSDSNQRSESPSDLIYRFDNLLRELTLSRSSCARDGADSRPQQARLGRHRGADSTTVLPASPADLPVSSRSASDTVLEELTNRVLDLASSGGAAGTYSPHVVASLREHESFNRLVSADRNRLTPNSSADSISQVFANGYVASDEENDGENAEDSDHEGHSDSENFYDDNFEDYDEQYIIAGDGAAGPDELTVEEQPVLEFAFSEEVDNRFSVLESLDARYIQAVDNRFVGDENSGGPENNDGSSSYHRT
ncbi:TPR repeat-containing protein DDB_G0287407-like isoform X2 [Physella acuta]|uniref:TPR repeat-containing protein DDB_G0287407-like isoform X2 n=1 Tax=Physella acuta TaxID=109671 RepID=UPI0027DBC9DA|nr:TPR repeat-containing protein DDB_G0287407-like isoform X2 [Physella acuta]